VFENRGLRRIFVPKRDEVKGGWRKLHNKELHNLYSSPDIRMIKSRRIRWGHAACTREMRNTYKIVNRKPEGKRSLGRPGRWEDNIKINFKEAGWESVLTGFIWLRIEPVTSSC
jgi:hypothetical protein